MIKFSAHTCLRQSRDLPIGPNEATLTRITYSYRTLDSVSQHCRRHFSNMEHRGLAAINQDLHIMRFLQIVIAVAYFFPSSARMYFARKRREFLTHWNFWFFGTLLIICGDCHFAAVWTVLTPNSWLHKALHITTPWATVRRTPCNATTTAASTGIRIIPRAGSPSIRNARYRFPWVSCPRALGRR